jgi:hypothetical protein
MKPKTLITLFQLPMFPAAFGLCGLDQDDNLYFHSGFISEQSLRRAHRDKGLKIFCRKLASACRPTNMLWVPGRTV